MTKLTPVTQEALSRVPYLASLPAASFQRLADACEVRFVDAGRHIFDEGAPPEGVFLILQGVVRVSRVSPDGREQVLHDEGPGATLGEVPAFDGKGYVGTAIVTEPATLVFVPRRVLLAEIQAHQPAAADVIRILAARVRRFAALAADISLRTLDVRVASYLLAASTHDGDVVELPGTRELWASHLGTVREQASRALSQLQRDGAVSVSGRRVTIRSREKLAARLRE
jgi:CRP/FNR family transcriptional regulator